ncbi:MAG: hypothetical protein HY687_01020 [Chloroflexi bacterium]|nr:hypothetical protein [Chloroflexota bacterium]
MGFNASRYLIQLKGRDYLEVKWRLLWLRTEHPEALVETELKESGQDRAVFMAHLAIPGGGSATGWGSETAEDFPDYLEKAETKALGRALAALGYGTQFCEDFAFFSEEHSKVVDAPVQRPTPGGPKATPAQVTAIYTIGREVHHLGQEEVAQRCRERCGRPPEELSKREASQFIDQLKAPR